MKKFIMAFVCLMTMVVSANAQNPIVDELLKEPYYKVVVEKYDELMLNPNKSIKDNYTKIDSLMSLHKENTYYTYVIVISGHYRSSYRSYDKELGKITVKYKNILINKRIIDGQIIEVLTELYTFSLDKPFNVAKNEQGNLLNHYFLYSSSPLFKKIYNKVMTETGLKDEGEKIPKWVLNKLEIDYINRDNKNEIKYKIEVDVETDRSYKYQNDNVPKELEKEKGKRKKNKQEGDGVYYQLEK